MRENEWSVARAAGQLAHRAASRSSRPLGVPGSRSDCDPPPPEGIVPWGNPVAWRVFVPVNFLSLRRDQGGSDLWLLPEGQEASRLVGCGADRCTGPAFSPDGRWIAYGPEERSADGSRLAFFDGNLGAIRVIALEGGQEEVLPTQMGLVGSWSPGGMRMLFPVMNLGGPQPTVELHAADLALRAIRHVLGPDSGWGHFSVPVWSPDGEWILIGLQTPGAGPARQAWIMRPDGSDSRALLDDPAFTFGGFQWDPWGQSVAFQRFRLNAAEARPDVLVLDLASRVERLIASDAWMPGWQP